MDPGPPGPSGKEEEGRAEVCCCLARRAQWPPGSRLQPRAALLSFRVHLVRPRSTVVLEPVWTHSRPPFRGQPADMMRRVTLRRQGAAGERQRACAKPSHCVLRVLQVETHLCLDAPPDQPMALLRLAGASGGIGVRFTKAVNGPCKIVHIAPGVRICARKCKPHQPGHGFGLAVGRKACVTSQQSVRTLD